MEAILSFVSSAPQEITSSFIIRKRTPATETPLVRVATIEQACQLREKARPLEDSRDVASILSDAREIFSYGMPMDHPAEFGFIPAPASPLSFIGDMLISSFNPHARSWFESSGPTAIEVEMIRFLAERIGLPATAGGLFVSGGSMANLIALMIARDQKLGKSWKERAKGVIYISDQTHSSIAKGLRILGFEDSQIRKIKSDVYFQMDTEELSIALLEDHEAGLLPFLIVANCGTTNTGSVDLLATIARVARQQSPCL
jgi:L-2,4-diaminobutyrate decarboxylase